MKEKSMTALLSCFVRAYHSKNYKYKIFNDYLAEKILSKEEFDRIELNLKSGIKFFNPNFIGDDNVALRWIVDNQLSPSVLARSVFAEDNLKNEIRLGLKQYLVLASGYDTSAYRLNNNILKYEIDKQEVIDDKIKRLKQAGFNKENIYYLKCDFTDKNWIDVIINSNYDMTKKSFYSLLGISYYLTKEDFRRMIMDISNLLSTGSVILFDYPNFNESEKETINQKLANAANEEMKSKYSYEDIEKFADECNMLVYKNLNHQDIDNEYFYKYNTLNPNNKILAPIGVNYCLIVKR